MFKVLFVSTKHILCKLNDSWIFRSWHLLNLDRCTRKKKTDVIKISSGQLHKK